MQSLIFLALALVNIALLVHLTEKVLGYRKRWRDNRLLVNNHPEMKLVDPGHERLKSADVGCILSCTERGFSEAPTERIQVRFLHSRRWLALTVFGIQSTARPCFPSIVPTRG